MLTRPVAARRRCILRVECCGPRGAGGTGHSCKQCVRHTIIGDELFAPDGGGLSTEEAPHRIHGRPQLIPLLVTSAEGLDEGPDEGVPTQAVARRPEVEPADGVVYKQRDVPSQLRRGRLVHGSRSEEARLRVEAHKLCWIRNLSMARRLRPAMVHQLFHGTAVEPKRCLQQVFGLASAEPSW